MPLDLAFIELAHRCAPQVEIDQLAAVVQVQSGFNPFSIRVGWPGVLSPAPKNKGEAISAAVEAIDDAKPVRLGLAGLEARQLGRLGLSIGEAFDPCRNLEGVAVAFATGETEAMTAGLSGSPRHRFVFGHVFLGGERDRAAADGFATRVEAARVEQAPTLAALVISFEQKAVLPIKLAAKATRPPALPVASPLPAVPSWDVYGSARGAGVLVFSKQGDRR